MAAFFVKDPADIIDCAIDWSLWLEQDTISGSTWTVDTGLVKESDTKTETVTAVVVSGGTAGQRYHATNQITTAAGRIREWTIEIRVEER